jgi:transposase
MHRRRIVAKVIMYVGLDVHKDTIAVALAEAGKRGEVREYGKIANTAPALRSLVSRLDREHQLRFCYEAGPCGYGIQRQLGAAGQECVVVAPSLIPRKPGERIKTDRRDAIKLARSHRAGDLTPVWVPDEAHEAMRDLVRARTAAVRALRQARQQLSSFLLRHGHHYQRTPWTQPHRRWLAGLKFAQAVHHIVLEDLIATVEAATARRDRLEQHIEAALPEWTLAPVVHALQSLRGLRRVAAAALVAELGDITRFDNPRQLMAYLGLVPSEASSGHRRRQGGITKAGNGTARRMLIEAAWTYRFPARISRELLLRQETLAKPIRDIAWKAQERLCRRYRKLIRAGKLPSVTTAAIARELVGFVWAIAREVRPNAA